MEYNKFEKQIANTLRQDEATLDINALIQGIHGNKKKRRNVLIIWFFAVGIFIAASGIIYLSFGQVQGETGVVAENKSFSPITNANNTPYPTSMIQNEITPNINEKNDQLTVSGEISSNRTANEIARMKSSIAKNKLQGDQQSTNTSSTHENYVVENFDETNLISGNSVDDKRSRIEELGLISNSKTFVDFDRPQINTDKVVCPTFSSRHKWYFEVIPEVGYFRPLKTFENNTGEQNNIFDLRNEHEKTLEGLQAALYVQLRKQKTPFYLKTGISYAKLTEKMELDYSYTQLDTTRGIISVTVSQTGDTVTTIIGDIVTESKLSGKKVAHHSFSLFDIPIGLGYEKKMGLWSLGIEGGVMLNLSMTTKGSTLDSDTSFVAVNNSNQFRTNLGLSYFGGVNIGRDVRGVGRFYVAARARFIPGSFSIDQNRFRQSYHFVGLHLGYVYTF